MELNLNILQKPEKLSYLFHQHFELRLHLHIFCVVTIVKLYQLVYFERCVTSKTLHRKKPLKFSAQRLIIKRL